MSEAVAALDPVDLKRLQGRLCSCQAPAVPGKLGAVFCDLFFLVLAQLHMNLKDAFEG